MKDRERQQFTWTNKMMNYLISSTENFKALSLMEFKGQYFEGAPSVSAEIDKHNKRYFRKKYVKNMRVLRKMNFATL